MQGGVSRFGDGQVFVGGMTMPLLGALWVLLLTCPQMIQGENYGGMYLYILIGGLILFCP